MSFGQYLGVLAIVAALFSGWAIYCAKGKRFWQFAVGVVALHIAFGLFLGYLNGQPLVPTSAYGFFSEGVWAILPAVLIVSVGNMVKSGSSSALRIFILTFVLCWVTFLVLNFLQLYVGCYAFNECM